MSLDLTIFKICQRQIDDYYLRGLETSDSGKALIYDYLRSRLLVELKSEGDESREWYFDIFYPEALGPSRGRILLDENRGETYMDRLEEMSIKYGIPFKNYKSYDNTFRIFYSSNIRTWRDFINGFSQESHRILNRDMYDFTLNDVSIPDDYLLGDLQLVRATILRDIVIHGSPRIPD